jgi:hypothetical protein
VSGRETLRVIGGSMDGETVPALDPDGCPFGYMSRPSTGEVWLRFGDDLRLISGAEVMDGYIAFTNGEPPP